MIPIDRRFGTNKLEIPSGHDSVDYSSQKGALWCQLGDTALFKAGWHF